MELPAVGAVALAAATPCDASSILMLRSLSSFACRNSLWSAVKANAVSISHFSHAPANTFYLQLSIISSCAFSRASLSSSRCRMRPCQSIWGLFIVADMGRFFAWRDLSRYSSMSYHQIDKLNWRTDLASARVCLHVSPNFLPQLLPCLNGQVVYDGANARVSKATFYKHPAKSGSCVACGCSHTTFWLVMRGAARRHQTTSLCNADKSS